MSLESRTKVVGLTGGIGSGKSTVARMLAERGAAIVDADAIARRAAAPGTETLERIRKEFGEDVIGPGGELDRQALGETVFIDQGALARLEAIIHPEIARMVASKIEEHKRRNAPVVIYEAALIVEKGLRENLDGLIVVSLPQDIQARRVMEREELSEEEVRARIKAQLPLERKVEVADWVVDNSGTLEETEVQVDEVWRAISE